MASGDPFIIKQEAGGGSTFSYTATADLVITCYATTSAGQTRLGNYVASTSGVNTYLNNGDGAPINSSNYNKVILLSGESITMNNVDVNVYGVYFGGFEL